MRYIGLDVHKDNITACVLSSDGKPVLEKDYIRDDAGWDLSELLERKDREGICVMMESGTYAYRPYRYFSDRGIETHVVHARALKMITQSDRKTDKKDAFTIARMLRLWKLGEIELQMAFMPSREQCELKDVCRYREDLSSEIGNEIRRIRSHLARNCVDLPEGCSNLRTIKCRQFIRECSESDPTLIMRLDRLESLISESASVQREIESRLPDSRDVEILMSVPGIARQSAVQIMSMIVDIGRFRDPEKLCSYFGMVPRVRNSGGKNRSGHMTKSGDRMMRSLMERVTESHIRHCDSPITRYYERKCKDMGARKALITTSRKMLSLIFTLLSTGRDFDPCL